MQSGCSKPILTVAFLVAICLVKFTVCKSIDDGFEIETPDEALESKLAKGENFDQDERNSKPISDDEFGIRPLVDEAMESNPAKREKPNETQKYAERLLDEVRKEPVDETLKSKSRAGVENSIEGQRHSKRGSESSQSILDKCFSGGFEETLKALGVLDLPGVRLVRVEGELYKHLLINRTLVKLKSEVNNQSIAKRSSLTDMCEENFAFTYVLAHASGQIAYQVDTIVCQGSYCQSSYIKSLVGGEFGQCVLEEKSMIVYVMDTYGNFVPLTINIGCACDCMTYY